MSQLTVSWITPTGKADSEVFEKPSAAAKFAAYKTATGCTAVTTGIQSNQRAGTECKPIPHEGSVE